MGLLRPARRITTPSGDEWEVYVSKTALPAWRGTDSDEMAIRGLPDIPIAIVAALWANVLVPLVRMLVLLPIAVVRGHSSRAVRIEAVSFFPKKQVLLWTTTDVHVARVVDEIAAGLAEGKIVHPDGAFYSGPEDS